MSQHFVKKNLFSSQVKCNPENTTSNSLVQLELKLRQGSSKYTGLLSLCSVFTYSPMASIMDFGTTVFIKAQTAVNTEFFFCLISLLKISTSGICEVDLKDYNYKTVIYMHFENCLSRLSLKNGHRPKFIPKIHT